MSILGDFVVANIQTEEKVGLLDHKWLVRSYLTKNKSRIIATLNSNQNNEMIYLLEVALSPFKYLDSHQFQINRDISLNAIYQLCSNRQMVTDIDYTDEQLKYLSRLFNELIGSDRVLYMCYDCGTVARGVFFTLIKAYRGTFTIRPDEIRRIKSEYYMNKYSVSEAFDIFYKNLLSINQNCLYLCALQFGDKFGHIYIIEKIFVNGSKVPRYRIYQSSFQSYLLIDYIELMNYASSLYSSVNIMQHFNDMRRIMLTDNWGQNEIDLFIKLYHFKPVTPIVQQDTKRFASTYVIF